ncbi:MAG: D-glycero-alpha-D-manno-heptose-1,7-bisphosphate 7-phosphatase [Thermoplasmatota archaeon]
MDLIERMERLRISDEPDDGTRRAPPMSDGRNRAVFVDRDGVINHDTIHLWKIEELSIIEGVKEAMEGFRDMGFLLVVTTNQAGIGKGLYGKEEFIALMEEIVKRLGGEPPWDRVYFSPYHSEAVIERYRTMHVDRKPEPGMLLRGARDLDIDLKRSYMVGDHIKDVQAAHRAGCSAVLVLTGRGKNELKRIVDEGVRPGDERYPDMVVQDIMYAYLAIRQKEDPN